MRRTTVVILVMLISSAVALMAGAQKHRNHNVLGIEFIGPKDHLIGPIVISDSKKGADWFSKAILKKTIAWDYTPEFVVSASVMKSLIAEAEVHRSIAQHELSNTPEIDQTVRITGSVRESGSPPCFIGFLNQRRSGYTHRDERE